MDESLFNILVCPVCKGVLAYTDERDGLVCAPCDHTYSIEDGIPVMMPPEHVQNN